MPDESNDDDRPRNEHGQFADAIDPTTALDAFRAREDPCEPLDAGEVADAIDIARRTAYDKLQALADDGTLATKKVGRNRIWWVRYDDLDHDLGDDPESDDGTNPGFPGGGL